ncbi:hypothetical protein [Streptomyces silvensis]|uniref:Uncharacterized protein n=1 Tax=Streptomyces silvensis TaxID=1765722 RepID=A0A0W7X963_9ACTN|nr:hypothetical protein [Streptomyces silvensis]KUF19500.1 hypothetical protein AT728_03705 [Streptomyces silvensis]
MAEAFVSQDVLHRACGVCPSRRLPVGEFDVHERPSREAPFDPADGYRYSAGGVPVCVHPEKVGLPAAGYKSEGAALVMKVELPATEAELVPYLHDLLYGAAPVLLDDLIGQASAEIPRVFPGVDVVETLRRALS